MDRKPPFRERVFLEIGKLCRSLPGFRGRTRLFLLLYSALGLQHRHVKIQATLNDPIGFVAELDLHSWLQRIAFLTGGYESDTVRFLQRLHESRGGQGYLLDIGANIGLISIPFTLTSIKNECDGGNARVAAIAIEAVPDNCQALRTNVALNELAQHVLIHQAALGESAKTIKIQVEGNLEAGQGTGTANILPDESTYQCTKQTLELRKLDGLGLPAGCSVIKIDTDGYDLKVLQGGVEFLKSERPVIFGEFSAHCLAWHGQTLADVKVFAADNGYCVWEKLPGTLKFTTTLNLQAFVQDLLLVPEELVQQYVWCIEPTCVPK